MSDNRVTLAGLVSRSVETRTSPAGIPISRFTLEHQSMQMEAGMEREARCKISVVAAGKGLQGPVRGLQPGQSIRVEGFLSRSSYRSDEAHLVLHAERVEPLD